MANRKREVVEKEKKIELLDINLNTELGWGGKGLKMETRIYRKDAVAYMYIQAKSAHLESLKTGMIKGKILRHVSLYSRAREFDKA